MSRIYNFSAGPSALPETVLQQAAPCDCVLIAGKGHENYQIMGQETHYFSDQAVVNDVVMRSR